MKLFNKQKFETLDDLLLEQIEDLYDAEKRLSEALPKMMEAANNTDLVETFRTHHKETEQQIQRLEKTFGLLGQEASREMCDAMKGLISEAEDMIEAEGDPDVRDAALIAAAQRIEHYEMAGYGSARAFANRLGKSDVATLLQETLDEEKEADRALTGLAETEVNPQAVRS